MIKLFGYYILSKSELASEKWEYHVSMQESKPEKELLHCGYKSCSFKTTEPKGLRIHRARMHRKK